MGGSGKWLKSLIDGKKLSRSYSLDKDNSTKFANEKSRRWPGLWKHGGSRSRANRVSVREQHDSDGAGKPGNRDVEAAVCGHMHAMSLQSMREEWAAIKIQTVFRGFLSRRALKALRSLVRLQALVRGHLVRRQAAMTLRCMQALVRVQARVRACSVRMSEEGFTVQQKVHERRLLEAQLCASEKGWCDSRGSIEEVQAKLQQKQEGAIKRDRAMAYVLSHQWRSKLQQEHDSEAMEFEPDKTHWEWSWLERWMAARPWENRSARECMKEHETLSPRSYDEAAGIRIQRQVRVERNGARSRRVMPPKPWTVLDLHTTPRSSIPSSDPHECCSQSTTTNSKSTTPTLCSGNVTSHSVISGSIHHHASLDDAHSSNQVPGYMIATQSSRAKYHAPLKHKPTFDDLNFKRSYDSEGGKA